MEPLQGAMFKTGKQQSEILQFLLCVFPADLIHTSNSLTFTLFENCYKFEDL